MSSLIVVRSASVDCGDLLLLLLSTCTEDASGMGSGVEVCCSSDLLVSDGDCRATGDVERVLG